ncbi:MAG TPA: hypothetical protein EYO94_01605 [Acidobacteria bacterium]|nr:hypothetical protein [Acidobacteriota bacterium]
MPLRPIRAKNRNPGVCCRHFAQDRSVGGRFLEHSRRYYFKNSGNADVLTGKADLMKHNLARRVEALCYVRDIGSRSRLHDGVREKIPADTKATELHSGGSYQQFHASVKPYNAQESLLAAHSNHRPSRRLLTVPFLVAIVLRFVRPLNRNANIISLVFR